MIAFAPMKKHVIFTIALLSITSAHTVQAISYYEHIQLRSYTPPVRTYSYPTVQPYRYPEPTRNTYNNNYNYSSGNCLYRNTNGECMIEQFYEKRNNNTYYSAPPTYDRNYLYNERRYNGRDDDDDYLDDDDDYYDDDYYDDDDDDDDDWEDIKDDFFGDDDDDSDDDD